MDAFEINIAQARIDQILDRVRAFDWHEAPSEGGWGCGTDFSYMRALADYWVGRYDWRAAEASLNAWPQFIAKVDDLDLHFYHVKGVNARKTVLLLHGWPGSVLEFLALVGPFTDPARFGGDAADAVNLVIPSLPGYGFSGKPARPIGPRRIARLCHKLMHDVLGYERYIAQGGDWGSVIAAWLGFDHAPACAAVHLNMIGVRPPPDDLRGEAEIAWARAQAERFRQGGAYFLIQASKPLTLSYAMNDSPVGAAAWIVEKFHAWSDLRERAQEPGGAALEMLFSKDQLLTNVMIYLVSRSFQTATWLYRGLIEEGSGQFPGNGRVEVPVAVANFPGDRVYVTPPRSLVERSYRVTHWVDMPRGGHFAAMEAGDLLLGDVRAFARMLA